MLRYNKKYQQRADELAREDDYWEFALYAGHFHGFYEPHRPHAKPKDWLVFIPMHGDSIPRNEGMPHFILVNEKHIEMVYEPPYCFDIMRATLNQDTLYKGRRIYQKMLRKHETGAYAPTDDQEFISQLMQLTMGGDLDLPLIRRQDAYLFLQESKRLNRRLSISTDEYDPYIKML